jgi:predicted branched-subunit amino acid permease
MNANALSRSPASRTVSAILLAGVIAATCDMIFACTFNGLRSGVSPERVMQFIASGWVGYDAARAGGLATAALGFVSHYGILIVAAALYFVPLSRSQWMRSNAVLCGALYGVCIYAFMHLVVLPLSNAPAFKPSYVGIAADFSMHVLVIGPAIALSLRKFARLT